MALYTKGNLNNSAIVPDSEVPKIEREYDTEHQDEQKRIIGVPLTPRQIYDELCKSVIGQEEAKRLISIAASNHLKRSLMKDPGVKKANIMIIGPTGCGKTHLVSSLAKILDVPFVNISASGITATGYYGGDVEDCIRALIINASKGQDVSGAYMNNLTAQAQYNIEKAKHGIVFIDEIDKLRKQSGTAKDIGGETVQQSLLTMMEGATMSINMGPAGRVDLSRRITIDTSDILFVFGGAFPGIVDIVRNRLAEEGANSCEMGETEIYEKVKEEDLEAFGLIPEFIGRVPILAHIRSLTEDDFARILTEPRNSVFGQYQKMFLADRAELKITDAMLRFIAKRAKEKKRGARGLRSVLEEQLSDAQFISASFPGRGLQFFVTLLEDGRPGTIVQAPSDVADEIRRMISSEEYGQIMIKVSDESKALRPAI